MGYLRKILRMKESVWVGERFCLEMCSLLRLENKESKNSEEGKARRETRHKG